MDTERGTRSGSGQANSYRRPGRNWLVLLAGLVVFALMIVDAYADPGSRPPRPTVMGRVGQGASPCSTPPSDVSTMRVVLIADNGDGSCNESDTDAIIDVGPSELGGYVFPAATGEPDWTEPAVYCIGVERVSLATPPSYGTVEPGTDDTAPAYVVGNICAP